MRPTSPRLDSLPLFSHPDWNTTILALGAEYAAQPHGAGEVFFVQIGAMDGKSFDPIFPHVKKNRWPGLVVEPLPDYFASLQENYSDIPGMLFERAAVAETGGTLTMRRINPQAIADGTIPAWVGGVSTSMMDRGVLGGQVITDEDYQKFLVPNMEEVTVPAMTWADLLAKHHVQRFAALIVDVEGAEWSVLRQIDLAACQPRLAYIEYSHMPNDELEACLDKFAAAGYHALREAHNGENLLFIRQA